MTLERLGVRPSVEQRSLYAVVASVLMLGSIAFEEVDDGSRCKVAAKAEGSLGRAADLLGCSVASLERAVSQRTLIIGGNEIVSPLSAKDAAFGRDSLSKAIYSEVFDWLVRKVSPQDQSAISVRKVGP